MSNAKPIKRIIKCEPCNGTGEILCPEACLHAYRTIKCGKTLQDVLCHTCLHDTDNTEGLGMINCFDCDGEGTEVNELWEEAQELHENMNQLFEAGAKLLPSGLAPEAEAFMQFIGA